MALFYVWKQNEINISENTIWMKLSGIQDIYGKKKTLLVEKMC